MSTKIGARAKIIDVLHSPARTRSWGASLIGQRGTVVMVLCNNTLALLQLDTDAYELPGGVRRWPVHWDDLLVYAMESETPADGYRLGLSGEDRQAVHHAVPRDAMISLCGEPVRWLPICGRSIRFSPRAFRACPECVHLATLP